eukprot:4897456-Pleurochrysis_carterae.AAC.1
MRPLVQALHTRLELKDRQVVFFVLGSTGSSTGAIQHALQLVDVCLQAGHLVARSVTLLLHLNLLRFVLNIGCGLHLFE